MISSLKIKNFQSHDDSTLDFVPGVNMILGSSDSGKSAIIRALKWVVWNRPNGDAFRSNWGGDTEVEVITDDEYCIRRGKNKENYYYIGADGTDVTLKAFKSDVPDEVKQKLNMDNTNLQNQIDSPFLISNTPGEVASYFNKIAHLDQIDVGNRNVQAQVRNLTSTIKITEGQLEESKAELVQYEYLDKFVIELEQLEADVSTCLQVKNGRDALETLIRDIDVIGFEITEAQPLINLEGEIDTILKMWNTVEELDKEKNVLDFRITEYKDVEVQIEAFVGKESLLAPVDAILEMMAEQTTIRGQRDSFTIILDSIKDSDSKVIDLRKELVDMEDTFHQFMPTICPLCGSESKIKTE